MISIIIPVYNDRHALPRALASLSRQTYCDFEVIIVDDGSDAQIEITRDWKQFYPRPIVWLREEHRGASAARNTGFAASSGDEVIFWDADVIALPHMLARMHDALQNNPSASYAYANYRFGWKKMPARPFDAHALRKKNYIMTSSLIRRSAFPGFDETLRRFQDWDLWLSMQERGFSGIWIDEYLFRVVPHRGGMSEWLPSFAYRDTWRRLPGIKRRVCAYDAAREIILRKHGDAKDEIKNTEHMEKSGHGNSRNDD